MSRAELASLKCFYNSFLRDLEISYSETEKGFVIEIDEDAKIIVKTIKQSLVGVHSYTGEIELLRAGARKAISFIESVKLISAKEKNLFERVNLSLAVMDAILEKNPELSLREFLSSEQALVVGHNFHPAPKSRDEFSDEDTLKFSPEFKTQFQIKWILLSKDCLWTEESSIGFKGWPNSIYPHAVPQGYFAYPMHPWQFEKLMEESWMKEYIASSKVLLSQGTDSHWFPTSSLRTLFCPNSPYMVKFSMSVKLTNSIRHMQMNEVVRGMQVHDAFLSKKGREFSAKYPRFEVMHEPACFGIKDKTGNVLPETIVLLRENPFLTGKEESVVLATLIQDHPIHGFELLKKSIGENAVGKWFEAFLDEVISPFIHAQGNYGIMLGAHQQNLVIKLSSGMPVGAYFRDCQGTGISEAGFAQMRVDVPHPEKLKDIVVPMDSAKILFTYYLIINSVLNTIHSVSECGASEEILIHKFIERMKLWRENVEDASVIDYVLDSEFLQQKGNFLCSKLSINENTTSNPLSIYSEFKNPFFIGKQ